MVIHGTYMSELSVSKDMNKTVINLAILRVTCMWQS